ncbi:MAG: T9SS type A sorting domain-containing protein [Ignavibacteria bacterium]|nr:T9SS type A sorting domain-containing protein [Ignavibacteria bacterium]
MNTLSRLAFSICFVSILQTESFAQFPSFRLYPSTSNQIEPTIVRHPANPNIMFASAYTIRLSFRSEGVYLTTDGGATWKGTDTLFGQPITNHGGDPGPIIDKDGRLILTHQGGFVLGMYANYSTNFGQTWSGNIQIAGDDQDKGSPATDDVINSPYYGRTYLIWTRFTNPFPAAMSYTTNGGANWTPLAAVNNSLPGRQSLGPVMVIGPDGVCYASWSSASLSSPFNELALGFAKSTNGGVNWSVNESVYQTNGIKTSSLSPWGIRVNGYPSMDIDRTGGQRNGWLYVVTAEKNLAPAGTDPDIVFHRSTDGGSTWSAGVRVNQDPINNGRNQIFPAMRVDENGGINVVYVDNRNSPDSAQTYLSRSTDGGSTWRDFLVSDHKYKPKGIAGAGSGNQGDNIGITSGNNKLWPVWMDDITGVYQVWTAPIDLNTIGINQISNSAPAGFELSQNYPNPFNPSTRIRFSVPSANGSTLVRLVVYDISGKEIALLANQYLGYGEYEAEFNAADLPSGAYFYTLSANGNRLATKKMALVK